MNQKVIDNRKSIDTRCKLCFSALGRYKAAVDTFQQERQQIEEKPFLPFEKERQISVAAKKVAAVSEKEYGEISGLLGEIRGFAAGMEKMDIQDGDLMNALEIVKMGTGLAPDIISDIVQQFKGQRQALLVLQAACEGAGIQKEHYFKDMIFNADTRVEELDDMASRITIHPENGLLAAAEFAKALEKFAGDMGVELSSRVNDWADFSGVYAQAFRAAAGLGTADR